MRILIGVLSVFAVLSGAPAMATEEIAHSVVKEEGNIQIREYEETVVAEVTVEGTQREAPGKAFRILFNFISGENITSQEIPMTAPVSQEAVSVEIPMTTPVSQEQSGDNRWTIAFYMPNDMAYEATPKPKDERISIRRIPAKRMAAIKFSGLRTDDNIEEHEVELRGYLEENDLSFEDKPLYAFYDAPYVPWFLRRNEVLFTLKK